MYPFATLTDIKNSASTMPKLMFQKRLRNQKHRASRSFLGLALSGWQRLQDFAQIEDEARKPTSSRFFLVFVLTVITLVMMTLLMGSLTPAIAQSPAPPPAAPKIDNGDTAWMMMSSALVLLMTPGLAFFYGGLVRSRNVLNMMMMSFVSLAITAIIWVLWGYSLAFNPVGLDGATPIPFDTGIGSFIGGLGFLGLNNVGLDPDPIGYAATIPHQLFMVYQMMFAIITVALISGAVAERMSFKAYFWFLILWITFIYCPMAHMVWGRGYLGKIGALDFAGGTVVHILSGVSALVAVWMLGSRKDHTVKPIVPHNVPFVLLGVGLLWFGWFGFNGGSAVAIGDYKVGFSAPAAFVATMAGAAAGGLAWLIVEWLMKGKPTAVGLGSGFVAGLVGITPACGFVTPISAIVIGALVGIACYCAVNLKAKMQFDDALDTFPIHGVGGTVGAILTGIFATKAVNGAGLNGLLLNNPGQIWLQIQGVIIAYLLAGIGTFIILKILSQFMSLRVSPEVEDEGLDIYEHGEGAYGEEIRGEIAFAKQKE
jgi:Amt family ammonium transporter